MKILPALIAAGAMAAMTSMASAEVQTVSARGSHAQNYTAAQTSRAPATVTRIVRPETRAAAPRVTRTLPYSAPDLSGSAPVAETGGVRVFRGGAPSATRPCTHRSAAAGVTVFSGCVQGGDATPELAGGYQASPVYAYDEVPVVGIDSSICTRKIRRVGNAAEGRTRYDVCYSDLQPVYGSRVETLYGRLKQAARLACATSTSLSGFSRKGDCEKLAVDMAVYETGLQPLVNHHLAKTGGRPRVVLGPLRRY